jgi:periplasmic copper chaperone A
LRQEARRRYGRAMSRLVPIVAAALLSAGCERVPVGPRVTVDDAVVTLPAVPGRPGAAYFTLRTNTDATRFTGLGSPGIGRIELHETVTQGGVSRMRPVIDVRFGPDEPLTFAPGGRHAMLFGIDPSLRVGGTVPLTFSFDAAPPVTVEAEVRGPGGARADH